MGRKEGLEQGWAEREGLEQGWAEREGLEQGWAEIQGLAKPLSDQSRQESKDFQK